MGGCIRLRSHHTFLTIMIWSDWSYWKLFHCINPNQEGNDGMVDFQKVFKGWYYIQNSIKNIMVFTKSPKIYNIQLSSHQYSFSILPLVFRFTWEESKTWPQHAGQPCSNLFIFSSIPSSDCCYMVDWRQDLWQSLLVTVTIGEGTVRVRFGVFLCGEMTVKMTVKIPWNYCERLRRKYCEVRRCW